MAKASALTGVLRETFRHILKHPVDHLRLLALPLLLMAILDICIVLCLNIESQAINFWVFGEGSSNTILTVIQEMLWIVIGAAIFLFYAVPLHRFLLLDEKSVKLASPKSSILFFLLLVIEAAIFTLPIVVFNFDFLQLYDLPSQTNGFDSVLIYALVAAFLVISFVLSVRLVVVFPHIAITPPAKFEIARMWRYGKVYFWSIAIRVFRLFGLTLIVAFVVAMANDYIVSFDALEKNEDVAWFLEWFVFDLLTFSAFMVMVTFASFSYRRIMGHQG